MKSILSTVLLSLLIFSANAHGSDYAKISDRVFASLDTKEITPDNAFTFEVLEIDGKEIRRDNSKVFGSSPQYVLIESGNRKIKIVKEATTDSLRNKKIFEIEATIVRGKTYFIVDTNSGPILVPSTDKNLDVNKTAL
jgi:hypothetical protein